MHRNLGLWSLYSTQICKELIIGFEMEWFRILLYGNAIAHKYLNQILVVALMAVKAGRVGVCGMEHHQQVMTSRWALITATVNVPQH